jgi:hypothetical protein
MQHPHHIAQLVQPRSLELAAAAKHAEHHFAVDAQKDGSSTPERRPRRVRRALPWWAARADRPRPY